MKLVANANILFSLCNPSSTARMICNELKIKLYSPNFALKELQKYKGHIEEKTGTDFSSAISFLKEKIIFIDLKEYSQFLEEAKQKISDEKDADYLALAMKLKVPVWSNDRHFKENIPIQTFTTKELIEILT